MQDPKNRQKLAIWAPSHNFVGLYLRKARIDNRKKLFKQRYVLHISSQYGHMVNFGLLTAEIHPVV